MIELKSCPKGYSRGLDKVISPKDTVDRAKKILEKFGNDILLEVKRIDKGRLGIPVYFSLYGPRARKICPARKQMGKGPSRDQAEASAVMELIERYSFFSFCENPKNFKRLTWNEAKEEFGEDKLIGVEEIIKSVDDNLSIKDAECILSLVKWNFCEAYRVYDAKYFMAPIDWFKKLNEYNGASAGNTFEESILQGACELIERHVSAYIDRNELVVPTIDKRSVKDPVLKELIFCFEKNNILLWLKDFSLNFEVPTVGALAYDPSTFPDLSEIVFTAGTATSPEKAAIRAITEVAQLAGDFCTSSRYEPSGLRKFTTFKETKWVREGETVPISTLPDISDNDIYNELMKLSYDLKQKGFNLYSIDTTHKDITIPSNYNFVPGFLFRERTRFPSIGLFVGRQLVEEEDIETAEKGLVKLEETYGKAYFIPFFWGMFYHRIGDSEKAFRYFEDSIPLQPAAEEKSMVLFYMAHILYQREDYAGAINLLNEAIELAEDNSVYFNLRGICNFRLERYNDAKGDFLKALDLDAGSAIDLANLGMCYKRLGDNFLAKHYLKEALKLDPSIEFARENLKDLN